MKKFKLMTAVVAILLFSNFIFAGNPVKYNADKLANLMVDKLSKDIVLTDNQKVTILAKAKEFVEKRQNSNALSNETNKTASKKQAIQDYKSILDSILTVDQKNQLSIKLMDRKQMVINKHKTN